MTTLNFRNLALPGLVLLTVSLFVLPGCTSWRLDEQAVEETTTDEVRAGRPFDPTLKGFGFSSKAQQIERNVGIE